MKNLSLSLILLLLMIACKKNTATSCQYSVRPEDRQLDTSDAYIYTSDTTNEQFEVTLVSGKSQPVSISVGTLPAGITAQVSPAQVTPPGTFTLTLTAANAVVGSHEIDIVASSKNMASQTYKHRLFVTVYNETERIFGLYKASSPCGGSGSGDILVNFNAQGQLVFMDLGGFANSISPYANLDTVNNTFVIPPQTFNTLTVSGSGSYAVSPKKQITLNYTTTGAASTSCSSVLTYK